jgi:hypothetical protein
MSTRQASIRALLNIPIGELVEIRAGAYRGANLRRVVGIKGYRRKASTGASKGTVQSSPVTLHKWAARVGMYNDDPIWGEIFENVRDSRKRMRKGSKSSE